MGKKNGVQFSRMGFIGAIAVAFALIGCSLLASCDSDANKVATPAVVTPATQAVPSQSVLVQLTPPSVMAADNGYIRITGRVRNTTDRFLSYVEATCVVLQGDVQIASALDNGTLAAGALWDYEAVGRLSASATDGEVMIHCAYNTSPFGGKGEVSG